MALKAGRVGVAPDQVDEFGVVKSDATSGYTKQEADAKFETQEAAALLQPKTLAVPIKYLNGSVLGTFNTVQEALSGSYGEGALTNEQLTHEVIPTLTADGTVIKSITSASVKAIPSHKIAFVNLDLKVGTFATWSDCVDGLPKPSTNVVIMGIDRDSGKFVIGLVGTSGSLTFIRAETNPSEDHSISICFAYVYNSLT